MFLSNTTILFNKYLLDTAGFRKITPSPPTRKYLYNSRKKD